MKSIFTKYKWMKFVYGTLLTIAGVLIIIFAITDTARISQWLSIVVAITLFAYALALMATGLIALKKRYFDIGFIYGSIFVALGVVFLVNPHMIGEFITMFFATILCTFGGVIAILASILLYYRRKKLAIVLYYILAAISITGGVLAFVFKNDITSATYIITGGLISIAGVIQIVIGMYQLREPQKDKPKSPRKAKAINAKVSEPKKLNNKEDQILTIENNDNVIDNNPPNKIE